MTAVPDHPTRVFLRIAGRAAALTLLLAASCAEEPAAPAQSFPPPNYSYLTPLYLNVASIEVADGWTPSPDDISWLSPMRPLDALRRMAQDRLVASGSSGRAVLRIQDASLHRGEAVIGGHVTVELDIYTSGDNRVGFAEASAARNSTLPPDATDATLRPLLYTLTKGMMDDMNIEFEYEVRHNLHDWLQETSMPGTAVPKPVEQQPLDGKAPATEPAPAAPAPQPQTLSLPPADSAPTPLVPPPSDSGPRPAM